MNDYKATIGIVICLINVLTLFILSANIFKCYVSAVNTDRVKNKGDVDFYFLQLIFSLAFFFANTMALYTGYKAYILNPQMVMQDIIDYRFADRFTMLCVSVILHWIRSKHNPLTS